MKVEEDLRTAKFIGVYNSWDIQLLLFRLSEPIAYSDDEEDYAGENSQAVLITDYILVLSEEYAPKKSIPSSILKVVPEANKHTMIYPSDEYGNVLSWIPLTGSYIGGANPINAIQKMGFIIGEFSDGIN
jgi:hypothetical protein